MLFAGGIPYFGFTAVFESIANEFGWSYTQISLAASIRGLETGLLAPVVGLLVDRWGPRKMVFGGCGIMGLGLIFLSRINSLGMFYGAFVLIALGISATGHAAMMAAVANWFRKRVAIATGIMASGAALGGLMIPVVVVLIDMFQWRTAMLILGFATWVICLPLSLLVRD
ncbi:MAG: transporter, partial [Dehalococcoidia bacterium]|nr:transporter [Dehalococcoidia bacterium]